MEWETPVAGRYRVADRVCRPFLGRRIAYTYEVIEYEPDVQLVMRTAQGPRMIEFASTRWSTSSGP